MLRIDVITIFPGLFEAFCDESIVGIAVRTGRLEVAVHDLRDWTTDPHRTVDDSPYGGGPGMVMKPEPLVAAIEALAGPKGPERTARVIALSPQGERLDQPGLDGMAKEQALVLVCGRYEGVDQRAIELAVDAELSIGDYVLSGGDGGNRGARAARPRGRGKSRIHRHGVISGSHFGGTAVHSAR
jgi:tRNA (guanine37-N1)-methyltransferase